MPNPAQWALSLGLPILVVGGVIAAERVQRDFEAPEKLALAAVLPSAGYGPADQQDASRDSERHLAMAQDHVSRDPDSWLPRQVLSRALSQSYAIDGDFAALVEAGRQLAEGRRLAPTNSGPNLVTAEWAMSVHDLDLARAALAGYDAQVVKLSRGEEAAADSLRGDIAFYTGDMATTQRAYDRAAAIDNGPGVLVRQATLAKARGDFDEAIALLVKAGTVDSLRTPRSLANLAIQIGAIEFARGRYDAAVERYDEAAKLLPGYWKAQLYEAEAALVAGRANEAIDRLETVVDYNQAPEAMDALAMIYRHRGDRTKSREWSARAAAEWHRRIEALPSAAIAHAAEHELAFGNAARALDMARRNAAIRPYGEARILLAKALNANGRFAEARRELLAAEASGWRSALLFVELARSEQALDQPDAAREAWERALELNPEIESPQAALVWFAHG